MMSSRSQARTRTGFSFGETALATVDEGDEERRRNAMPLREYAEAIPEPGGRVMSFEDFPFQEEWYSEEVAQAFEVVLAKSAQIGASAWAWKGAVQLTDFGDTGVYVFPTDTHVREFGDERIEPGIEESPYLQSRIPKRYVKTKSLKRIGRGFLHLRGSNSKAGAQSIAAQFIFFDEYDLLDQVNLAQIERRISGAVQIGRTPRVRRLGYPFTPNTGIDAAFKSSDQRVWHVTCPNCSDEQPITWEENFRWTVPGQREDPDDDTSLLKVMRPGLDEFEDRKVVGDVWRQCRTCEASFEDSAPRARDGALRRGRWIAQNPSSDIVGFHAWRGMVPITDLKALVIASRATKEGDREAFSVLDLGRPYSEGTHSLDDATLLRACSFGIRRRVERYVGANPTTMGVDVAGERDLNVWIDEQLPPEQDGIPNPRQALWIGTASSFEEVAQMIDRFRVHMVAVDSNPERRFAKLLRATYPGRVVLVEYASLNDADPLKLEVDDVGVPLKARVNRTDAIDGMMDAIRQVRSRPLQDPPPGWMAQMKSLHRVTRLDKKGRPYREYVTTGTDGDDYAHAGVYALVATELWRALGSAGVILAERSGRPLPDEEFGLRRVNLRSDADQ
jgi:hypothetical protein